MARLTKPQLHALRALSRGALLSIDLELQNIDGRTRSSLQKRRLIYWADGWWSISADGLEVLAETEERDVDS